MLHLLREGHDRYPVHQTRHYGIEQGRDEEKETGYKPDLGSMGTSLKSR